MTDLQQGSYEMNSILRTWMIDVERRPAGHQYDPSRRLRPALPLSVMSIMT